MKDYYGRDINYMRISVTDRCNLRCRYCMPESGVESIGHDEILRFDEILKIVKIAASLGIENIKITGGEPLVRKEVTSLIGDIKALDGINKVTLTTNGSLLEENLRGLVSAGLDGVNISLDTLDARKYKELTGGGDVKKVLRAIRECAKYPNLKTKINVVSILGFNDDEVASFGQIAAEREIDVRFIEMMPIGMGKGFDTVYQDTIMKRLEERFGKATPSGECFGKATPSGERFGKATPSGECFGKATPSSECFGKATPSRGKRGSGPAVYYDFEAFKGKIGFISPLSHRFCEQCNRIRLTADGLLKPCLQYGGGADLKAAMRRGTSDAALAEMVKEAIFEKPRRHEFCSGGVTSEEMRLMSSIGG